MSLVQFAVVRSLRKCFVYHLFAQDEAELLGDRVIVISKGHVQAIGTAMELKQQCGACVRVCVCSV